MSLERKSGLWSSVQATFGKKEERGDGFLREREKDGKRIDADA
jgi:hypothetical protein